MSKDIIPAASSPVMSSPASPAAPEAGRVLSPAAQRALAEAAERRARAGAPTPAPKEIDGRGGPEPVRYGDWEVKGIASDF
ncbi:DUF1674 domain-containing protein [Ancylobacter sp. G4_0304]|uniref:DUF1674 domain-containing protein n=1 Tax=Ancylobacter sp. G4_0304 TaxID=3114289 RepID=UPI0039C67822